jgi:hypothetical protein
VISLKIRKISENYGSRRLSVVIYIPRMWDCRGFAPYIFRAPPNVYFKQKNSGNGPVLDEKYLIVRVPGLSGTVGQDSIRIHRVKPADGTSKFGTQSRTIRL